MSPGALRMRAAQLPVIGPWADWLLQLVRLPKLTQRVDRMEALLEERVLREHELSDETTGLRSRISELSATVGRLERDAFSFAGSLREIESRKAENAALQALDAGLKTHDAGLTTQGAQLTALDARLTALDAQLTSLRALEQRVAQATAAISRLRLDLLPLSPDASDDGASPRDEAARLASVYHRFEDRFRGSREEILSRLRFYAPILQAAASKPGAGSAAFVDLGCGRGEMIELLGELGLSAYGVEASEDMVSVCSQLGLRAVHADAIDHLAGLPDGSLAGITCIHVLEHLPFRAMVELVAQALRVLRPGGVAIFETPNPENLIVGACNFHYDPTHLRPLPPDPTRYMLETAGFCNVTIERLHPGASSEEANAVVDPVVRLYTTLMSVPQDYALIAHKPEGQAPGADA
jgi:SAM-dependent methyltransferase/prefoldin subunit 5